jgi:hypothetical protein
MWHAWERKEKCTRFWWESPKERGHSEDQGVGGKLESEWILGRLAWGGGVDWIRLAQDRDGWRAVMSAVMNLPVLAPRSYLVCYCILYVGCNLQFTDHSLRPPVETLTYSPHFTRKSQRGGGVNVYW